MAARREPVFGLMACFALLVCGQVMAEEKVTWSPMEVVLSGSQVYESDAYKRGIALPLWETESTTPFPEEEVNEHLYQVQVPTLEFFSLDAQPFEGGAERYPVILIAPGGGYGCLAYDKEGVDIARKFRAMGCHTAVLKYHVNTPQARLLAHRDAIRAIEILRENADVLKIDPQAIGMAGFSAGAHLTATCLAHPNHGLAFAILLYPAYLSHDGCSISPEVTPVEPYVPTFVMQCRDDRAYLKASLGYVKVLSDANAPIAYHLYSAGGHGFGGRLPPNAEAVLWHTELRHWFECLKNAKK